MSDSLELSIEPRAADVSGLPVARLLPRRARRSVGPFVFLDRMGPVVLSDGRGVDVPPHPHVGLATITYLFEGELVHRDSLGTEQTIRPGEVNWMSAGRGIVHSERSPTERPGARPYHGLQLWAALAAAHEDSEPWFRHAAGDALPTVERDGATARVLVGTALGASSAIPGPSPCAFVDLKLASGADLELAPEHTERALLVLSGEPTLDGAPLPAGPLHVLRTATTPRLASTKPARLALLAGAPLDAPRHMDWNFVATTRERLEAARDAWTEGRFPSVPGDDGESVPYPTRSV